MRRSSVAALLFAGLCVFCSCSRKEAMESRLTQLTNRFAPTVITADTTALSAGNRAALRELIGAAGIMDSLYLIQVWSGNAKVLATLNADRSPEGQAMLRYFQINMGPWSKLDHDSAFVPGVPERPLGANYYPEDMRKDEFETWVATLSSADKDKATGFFTTIRRKADRSLTMVPYSVEYKDLLRWQPTISGRRPL